MRGSERDSTPINTVQDHSAAKARHRADPRRCQGIFPNLRQLNGIPKRHPITAQRTNQPTKEQDTTLHHITSYHIVSHHITSHHITSHHITSHHITSYQPASHHDSLNIMDAGHKRYTFTAPPFEIPQRQNRLRPSNEPELDSPHIHFGLKTATNHGSQSDMSADSSSEAAIDEMTQQYLMQPRLGRGTSFEEFRMPPFSSLAYLEQEDLSESDMREFPVSTALSRTPPTTTHFSFVQTRMRTVSLDTAMLNVTRGSATPPSPAESSVRRFHRTRWRNKAMDSRQFDDILDQVFVG